MESWNKQTGDFTTSRQIVKLSAMAVIVGALCAVIAVVLMKMIGIITNLSYFQRFSFSFSTPLGNHLGWLSILVPVIGGIIIGLIARFGSEKIRGHGIPEAIEAMLINDSKVAPKVSFWKPISAAVSIGTGGPFGAEGPIIMTGGSFGSLIAQFLHFSGIERRVLLVAGAAGGMSATFAAPISSVLFAVELLMFEYKPRSLVPIAVASATADIIRRMMIGAGPMFPMPSFTHTSGRVLLIAAIIGLVGSILAVLLTWAIYAVEDGFRKLPIHWMWWPAIGGIVIGVGGLICPWALGVGYNSIGAMLNAKLALATIVALLIVKTIIWVVALGSGTSGGILAPILIIGGSLGSLAAYAFGSPHPEMWALLGMSAIFAGVTRTPFTSVLFPLELTHNWGALLPLLVASCLATGLSALILPRSILTEKIARRGLHMTREYSTDPLAMHMVKACMREPQMVMSAASTVLDALKRIVEDKVFVADWVAVMGNDGELLGAVDVRSVLHMNGRQDASTMLLTELLPERIPVVHVTDTVHKALQIILAHGCNWALVRDEDGGLRGLLTTDHILELRRHELQSEGHRERVFRLPLPLSMRKSPSNDTADEQQQLAAGGEYLHQSRRDDPEKRSVAPVGAAASPASVGAHVGIGVGAGVGAGGDSVKEPV